MTEDTPPRVKPRLKSAPKIRQLYWCDFPKDAQLPEFWKKRPVIIISKTSTLFGTVLVIPCTTKPQSSNSSVQLETTIDGRDSWAVCDKPYTVAVSRLTPQYGKISRLSQEEFDAIIWKLLGLLPLPRNGLLIQSPDKNIL